MANSRLDSILAKIESLGEAEKSFSAQTFLAPRLPGQDVTVRISGIIHHLKVQPRNFSGWGVFQQINRGECRWVREPSLEERDTYLKLFPTLRLLVCGKMGEQWYGIAPNQEDRIRIQGNVPINFAAGVQLFDTIRTSFDGEQFWYWEPEPRRSAVFADQLREALSKDEPEPNIPGLLPTEKLLYIEALERRKRAIEEAAKDRDEERLQTALKHAGATMKSYRESGDSYTVEYKVDGETHTSVVEKRDLTVRSAGICLSGGDRSFDLTSLVSVIREGQNRDRIVRVGINHYRGPYDE